MRPLLILIMLALSLVLAGCSDQDTPLESGTDEILLRTLQRHYDIGDTVRLAVYNGSDDTVFTFGCWGQMDVCGYCLDDTGWTALTEWRLYCDALGNNLLALPPGMETPAGVSRTLDSAGTYRFGITIYRQLIPGGHEAVNSNPIRVR